MEKLFAQYLGQNFVFTDFFNRKNLIYRYFFSQKKFIFHYFREKTYIFDNYFLFFSLDFDLNRFIFRYISLLLNQYFID